MASREKLQDVINCDTTQTPSLAWTDGLPWPLSSSHSCLEKQGWYMEDSEYLKLWRFKLFKMALTKNTYFSWHKTHIYFRKNQPQHNFVINNSSAANTYIHTACKQKMPTGHGVSMSFIQGAIDFFCYWKQSYWKFGL